MKLKDLLKILESADPEAEVKFSFLYDQMVVTRKIECVTHKPEKNEIILSEDI